MMRFPWQRRKPQRYCTRCGAEMVVATEAGRTRFDPVTGKERRQIRPVFVCPEWWSGDLEYVWRRHHDGRPTRGWEWADVVRP